MLSVQGSEVVWGLAGAFTTTAALLSVHSVASQIRLTSVTARRAQAWTEVTDAVRAFCNGDDAAGRPLTRALRRSSTRTIAIEAMADLARADRSVALRLRGRRDDVVYIREWVAQELRQTDPGRRARAAEVVGTLRLRSCRGPIAVSATDPDPTVRVAACRALAVVDPASAVGVLLRLVEHDGAWAANLLTDLLSRSATGDLLDAGRSILDRARDWAPTPALLKLLTNASTVGGDDLLVQVLGHDDPDLRARAAEALEQHDAPEAVTALVHLLSDANDQVRLAAVRSLGRLAEPDLLLELAALLGDDSRQVRFAAAAAIARTPGGTGVLRRAEAGGDDRAAEAAGIALWRGDGSGPARNDDPTVLRRSERHLAAL